MKLFTNGVGNLWSQTCLIAADLAGQQVEVVYKDKAAANEKEFRAMNLTGKFPLLQDGDDLVFESSAICQHIARHAPAERGLLGHNVFEAAQIQQWIDFQTGTVGPALMPVVYSAFGHKVIPQTEFAAGLKTLKAKAQAFNTALKGKHWLVGDRISVADVVCGAGWVIAFQSVFDGGFRKSIPHLTAWFERCIGLPSFIKALGHVKMTDKAMKAWDPNAPVEAVEEVKAPEPKADDDDLDLFGDDDEDDAAAAAAAAAAAKASKKKKKVVIAMSLVMLEVKPLDDTTNLDDLAKYIFANLTQDGLFWKTEYKKEPVAFGIFKLIIGFSLEDEKVSVDNVVERIEELEDRVQSVEIAAFNKI